MSLAESRGALTKASKDLANRWMQAKSNWRDGRAEYFEKEYLFMIEQEVRKALATIDHMNTVLLKIVKDCE
jgi:hypothetical protein